MLFLTQLLANGIHFDLGLGGGAIWLRNGMMRSSSRPQVFFPDHISRYGALMLRLGYRWTFNNGIFFDWDFLGLPTSFTTFKVGRLFMDRKLAIYGIIDPAVVIITPSLFGYGTLLGAGSSYQFAKNISFTGELHVCIHHNLNMGHHEEQKRVIKAYFSRSPSIRLFAGVTFHPAKHNQ